MAKTFDYSDFTGSGDFPYSQKKNVPEGYYGQSGRDEYHYRPEVPKSMRFKNNRIGNSFEFMRDTDLASHNRNFSALNLPPLQKQNIINQSYLKNNLLPPDVQIRKDATNSMQQGNIRGVGDIGVKPTGAGGTTTPPNFKNNLLNYLDSAGGKGMTQGLLEASGYHDRPISFGQALSMGMKRSNEYEAAAAASQTAAAASQFAKDEFAYKKEQDILNRALQYAQIKPASIPALQQNIRRMLKGQGLTPGTPEYDIAFANEIQKYLSKSGITVVNKPEDKGNKSWFEGRGESFSGEVDALGLASKAADDNNQSLNRFAQLSELAKTGTLAEFKSDLFNWASSLGLELDKNSINSMGATQALNSVAGSFVMAQVQKTKGAVSDREMAYFMKISANIGNSPLGNQLIINMARSINDRIIQEDILMRKYLAKQRKANKDIAAYDLELGWKEEQTKFRQENQLFEGDIKEEIKAFHEENGIEYRDSTKSIEDTLQKYEGAEYKGVSANDKLIFRVYVKGAYKFIEVDY